MSIREMIPEMAISLLELITGRSIQDLTLDTLDIFIDNYDGEYNMILASIRSMFVDTMEEVDDEESEEDEYLDRIGYE